MCTVIADCRIIAFQVPDQLRFFSGNFSLAGAFEKNLLSQHEIPQLLDREILFDQSIVPGTKVAHRVPRFTYIFANIDFSIREGNFVDDEPKFSQLTSQRKGAPKGALSY
jgi:hypothetical protein